MKTQRILLATLATAMISFVAWSKWNNDEQKTGAPQAPPLAVKVQAITPKAISKTLTVSGTLVGENEATIVAETNGKVIAVRAQIGDWLAKGQTILQLENDLKLVALKQAKAQLMAAQTNDEKSRKDLQRYEDLFKEQIATQNDIENARLAARAAEAQLKSAEAALKLAQRHYDDAAIKTPLSGRLADRYVDMAAMVMPGDKIGVIVDTRTMKLRSSVAENEVSLVKNGQPVEIMADALSGANFPGKVFSVAQKATGERTYPVEILVQNDKAESLKSGMFARASIEVEKASQAVVVPSAAVLAEANKSFVFVESNGMAKRIEVKVGVQDGGQTQIVDGLKSGDRLIVFGQQRLNDGMKVVVQE